MADAKGFQQNRDYFSQLPFEHIDTATGSLVLTFTDLVLPGPGGRDLKFQRTYNGKSRGWTFGLAGYPLYITDPAFPVAGSSGDDVLRLMPIIEGTDGADHPTYPTEPIDLTSQPRIGQTLNLVTTDRFWRYSRLTKMLYLPDGTTCRYEDAPGSPSARRLKECFAYGSDELLIEWGDITRITQRLLANRAR